MSIRMISILAATASLAGAGMALAQTDDYGPAPVGEIYVTPPYVPPGGSLHRELVSFADLDLNTAAGADTLMHRINGAVQRVCSPEPSTPADLKDTADHQRCMGEALERAVNDVDAPSLTDLYRYGAPRYARAYDYTRDNDDSGY